MDVIGEQIERLQKQLAENREDDPVDARFEGEVLSKREEEHLIWGWASVVSKDGVPVVDLGGDIIPPSVMEEAATEYMLTSRQGLDMHDGEPTAITVHSFPLTKQIAELFGISCDREGWIICQKVLDEDVWASIKQGDRLAFSIGGAAQYVEVDD